MLLYLHNNFKQIKIMSAQEQNVSFLLFRIEALRKENERLNSELLKMKDSALKIKLSDPNFDKKLSEIEKNYNETN